MTKIHHNFIEVDKLRPWKEYNCGVCSLTGGIPGDSSCEPTDISYSGLNVPVVIPNDPNTVLYYKVQVQVDDDPATEHILFTGFPDDNRGVLLVEFLTMLRANVPVDIAGEISFFDGEGTLHSYSVQPFGTSFGLAQDNNTVFVYGYTVTPDGVRDRSTTLTFLALTQTELDDLSNTHEVTAVDGILAIFGTHPTWRSCSYNEEV